jgi:hypothetical protein
MSVTPTAGIAAAWSAAKVTPTDQAPRPAPDRTAKAPPAAEAPEPKNGPPPAEGLGTRIDVRV